MCFRKEARAPVGRPTKDFFNARKYASVPGTFSLVEEQSLKSPASSFSQPSCPSTTGPGWWGPNTLGALWLCPTLWSDGSPWPRPPSAARPSPPWSSHDSELWGSVGRAHRCDGPYGVLSFLLLQTITEYCRENSPSYRRRSAPQPGPVD